MPLVGLPGLLPRLLAGLTFATLDVHACSAGPPENKMPPRPRGRKGRASAVPPLFDGIRKPRRTHHPAGLLVKTARRVLL